MGNGPQGLNAHEREASLAGGLTDAVACRRALVIEKAVEYVD
jgi:hypothetical protein